MADPIRDLWLDMQGEPVPKGRPRVTSHGTYTPERTRKAEERIGWAMLTKYPGLQVDGTSRFRVVLRFCTKKTGADVDNLAKTVLDGLQGVVWANDNQVDVLSAERFSLPGRMAPWTEIEIERIDALRASGREEGDVRPDRGAGDCHPARSP